MFQKPGNHANFRKRSRSEKAILGALGEFRGTLRAALGVRKKNSRNEKSHSPNGVSRLEQCESHNSRSNSRRDSRNWWESHMKAFHLHRAFSERFFKNWGVPRVPRAPDCFNGWFSLPFRNKKRISKKIRKWKRAPPPT